jgi:hypothetical protein
MIRMRRPGTPLLDRRSDTSSLVVRAGPPLGESCAVSGCSIVKTAFRKKTLPRWQPTSVRVPIKLAVSAP